MTRCSICNSPKSREIAESILAGIPQREIAERYNVAKSSLSRHTARHTLADGLRKRAPQRRPYRRKVDDGAPIDVGGTIERLIRSLESLREDETAAGRASSAAALSGQILRALEMLEKRDGTFGEKRESPSSGGGSLAKLPVASLLELRALLS